MQHIGFLSLKKFQLEFSGLKKTIVLSKMNMNKRKVYVVPEVRIVEVCLENLMNNPASWDDGSGNRRPIVEGNPDDGSLDDGSGNYAKWHGYNVWEDDIKY